MTLYFAVVVPLALLYCAALAIDTWRTLKRLEGESPLRRAAKAGILDGILKN